MNGFAAGLDGGGTKTAVCLLDATGTVLEQRDFGALNVNGAPLAQVQATLSDLVAWIFQQEPLLGPCRSLVAGTAGVSNPAAVDWIETSIRAAGYQGPLQITGDQPIALRGAVGRVGAILIAGTGSICYGQNQAGRSHRCGGLGYLMDDEGSGYAIGRDILHAVARAHDGRSGPTALTGPVFASLSVQSMPELVRAVYAHATDKSYIAALSPLLLGGLAAGDPASEAIAHKAVDALSELLNTVLTRLELQSGVFAFTGGILEHYPTIAQGVLDQVAGVHPKARYTKTQNSAAYGAAALAWDVIEKTFPKGGKA